MLAATAVVCLLAAATAVFALTVKSYWHGKPPADGAAQQADTTAADETASEPKPEQQATGPVGHPPETAGGSPFGSRPVAKDGRSSAPDPGVLLASSMPKVDEATFGLYSLRTRPDRTAWVAEFGGTPASEKAVDGGLAWLARHQAPDGSWSRFCLEPGHSDCRCDKDHPCASPGMLFEMAHTGLALLAFQAGGHYEFNNNRYSETVRKGLDWLVDNQRPDGGLIGSKRTGKRRHFHQQFMYEHGIATFTLAEACALERFSGVKRPDDRYERAMAKALDFIYQMQHDDGGWRYTDNRKEKSDSSVTGWQVLALKSAEQAGMKPRPEAVAAAHRFFDDLALPSGETAYVHEGKKLKVNTQATTGVGMLARQFLFHDRDHPMVHKAADHLATFAERKWPTTLVEPEDADFYLLYNCTLAMHQNGGEPWKRWNDHVRDAVVRLQRHDGCMKGSWDPAQHWGNTGGRIYSTALATLTLEVYYRFAAGEKEPTAGQGKP